LYVANDCASVCCASVVLIIYREYYDGEYRSFIELVSVDCEVVCFSFRYLL